MGLLKNRPENESKDNIDEDDDDDDYIICMECGKLEWIRDIFLCDECAKKYDLKKLWEMHDNNEIDALDFNESPEIRKRFLKKGG